MLRVRAIRERLRSSLWFIPAVSAAVSVTVGLALLTVDHQLASEPGPLAFLYGGTAEGARSVLSTIAQSMLTFTGLVFTITMLVLQLASSQLSPRVMRTFLRDRSNQAVLGLFVATFVYTLVVLRDVRAAVDGQDAFVPGVSVSVSFGLLLGCVGAFIYYIDHMAHAIRASTVIASIAAETEQALEHMYPERGGDAPSRDESGLHHSLGADAIVQTPRAGVVVGINEAALRDLVGDGDRHLVIVSAVGDFVPSGAPVANLVGTWDREAIKAVRDAVAVGNERSIEQDVAFGFRQLVDVAIRALSPGTNDPTTAIQAIDRLHDLLRRLVERHIPPPGLHEEVGRTRLVIPRVGWEEYVRLALDEIRLSGEHQVQIARRLRHLLEDLMSVAPPSRQAVLRQELELLEAAVLRAFSDADDAAAASRPSARGQGPATGSDVMLDR